MDAPRQHKSYNVNYSLHEKLGRVFDQFPRYDMKMLLGGYSAEVNREDIFKLTIGDER
jgi:hypothetical protein